MKRGTTQSITFTLPEEIVIDTLFITFAQNGAVVLEKTYDDVEISGKVITLPLSQEDTLAFKSGVVTVQLRLRDSEGNALASNLKKFNAENVLKEGVI